MQYTPEETTRLSPRLLALRVAFEERDLSSAEPFAWARRLIAEPLDSEAIERHALDDAAIEHGPGSLGPKGCLSSCHTYPMDTPTPASTFPLRLFALLLGVCDRGYLGGKSSDCSGCEGVNLEK